LNQPPSEIVAVKAVEVFEHFNGHIFRQKDQITKELEKRMRRQIEKEQLSKRKWSVEREKAMRTQLA